MSIKAAIFDFDGTLFDSMYVWENVTEKYLDTLNIKSNNLDESRLKSMSLLQAAYWIKDEFKLDKTPNEIMDGLNGVVRREYFDFVQPKKGVEEFLKNLYENDVKMVVASVSEFAHIDTALRRCRLRDYFVEIFSCSSSQFGKNTPDIFNMALERLQKENPDVDKSNTFVFEDALYAISVAKSASFRVIGVQDKSEKCEKTVRNLCETYIETFEKMDDFWKIALK